MIEQVRQLRGEYKNLRKDFDNLPIKEVVKRHNQLERSVRALQFSPDLLHLNDGTFELVIQSPILKNYIL